ncbi:recombinase family protein [Labedella endophytica]|jgi:DNA invertase Pin-like site-specific DNA recombinase|uniref:Resolvase/invertase-type recombinase catalytic domain-containing protein n=1 Tax=Labedella endophytica TaxID=1523160 RepID=A0A433JX13_9MICO|nr:recombinase family protein [Labedella endophytica]RUR03427.1 hypothetical protein ELQ94_02475 [Labedella endophytica]
MAIMGYARAVGRGDALEKQIAALEAAGIDDLFVDKLGAGREGFPALTECLTSLDAGDVLTVTDIESLPRGVPALVGVIRQVRARGAHFRELSGRYDTTTARGAAFFQWIDALEQRLE